MSQQNSREIILALDLTEQEHSQLQRCLGRAPRIKNYKNQKTKLLAQDLQQDPLLVLIPWRIWKSLPRLKEADLQSEDSKLMLIQPQTSDLGTHQMLSQCLLGIIPPGQDRAELNKALQQARDFQEQQKRLQLMEQEVLLERELLQRKNSQLQFLTRFMHQTSQSLEPELILSYAAHNLASFVPLQHLGIMFWKQQDKSKSKSYIALDYSFPQATLDNWKSYLLREAWKLGGEDFQEQQEVNLPLGFEPSEFCAQDIVDIPLCQQEHAFGLLSIQVQDIKHLGQDVLQTLKLAARHLALSLHNALQMSRTKDLADLDQLTGLYNRRYFDHIFKLEKKRHHRESQPLGLLFLDIDHFKDLNDTFGHQAGDLALQKLGKLLSSSLRETDTAARYGGEEFVLLLPNTSTEQAAILAERLRREISKLRLFYQDWELRFTVSIGVSSLIPDLAQEGNLLLEQADQALYQAKAKGRNLVCKAAASTTCPFGT
ncbi:MAG: sensor domain-containing diguanylate cyclase [Desulfohalobiaceae bacterium]